MTPRARRALFTVVLFFAVCAVVGSVLQRRVGAQTVTDESQLRDSLKSFTDVYSLVEKNYAEPINGDKADIAIYDGAIPGMLRVLDPHSNFYDPKAYARLREDQRGHYYGVGMVIQQQLNKVLVITPYEGTPSFRAGIHPGDVISAVDGKATDGWTSDQVAKALKGPKGTHVQVTTVRVGTAAPLVFDLVRDEIPHPSVDLKYEIRPGVGYIHLTQFQETTGDEMTEAINGFGDLKGLVIDLRNNPGGLLSQAVDVCDHLLTKGQGIVSQRGRAYPDQNYTANHGNGGKTFPIVVLVNRGTASAAEIVSGALQDHDRALIVGETTFGKGLVQTVYNLSENTGLALTTYHYYTPSGRLIQRDYSHSSMIEYYTARPKSDAPATTDDVKATDSGRKVYGGGGITPDEKYAAPRANKFQRHVLSYSTDPRSQDAFYHFAESYFGSRKPVLDPAWNPDADTMNRFKEFLHTNQVTFTEDEFAANKDWVRDRIRYEFLFRADGKKAANQAARQTDTEVLAAIDDMPKAESLMKESNKAYAMRAAK